MENSDKISSTLKEIVVIYHDKCHDGFGSAYSAWKKFGDTASYIPQETESPPPKGLTGKELYILDYSYNKETLEKLESENKSVMVIDHHTTAEATVTAFPGNIFDQDHSGAVLSWKYFHPNTEVPELLLYIEDQDLWRFELPENREYFTALALYPMTFESWDTIIEKLKDEKVKASFISKGAMITKYEDKIVRDLLEYKELVKFEGHDVWALNVARTHRSILGNRLAGLNLQDGKEPIGIVYYRFGGKVHVSLRSHGDTDVSEIAQKYGGGGHRNAASFRVKSFSDLPFIFK